MFNTILTSLLPIAIILLLGYFAGYRQDFSKDQASVLNKMVMIYALPLSLFSGIITTSISEIIEQKDLLLGLFIGMVLFYLIVYVIMKYLFKQDDKLSALVALAITGPAIPFVGVPVLGNLYGSISSIPISIGSLYMNLFQVPLTIIILNKGGQGTQNNLSSFKDNIISTLKQPIVWAPILGLVFVLLKIKLPVALLDSFNLLGKATGGVALFASGIILYSYKVVFDKTIASIVFAKNLVIPFLIWGIAILLDFPKDILKETVLTMSIPTASIAIILSIEYGEGQREISSTLFFSSILSILTMGLFMYLLT
jgi:malonate transporter and related proteins